MTVLNRIILRVALLVLGTLAISGGAMAQSSSPQPCQRECLEEWVNRYLAAMRDNNVDPELFTRGARFTENGVELALGGEGLWYGMSGIGGYSFYIPDVETQQVAFLGTVKENVRNAQGGEALVAVALRLKIDNGKISEIEQLAIRPDSINSSNNDFPETGPGVEAMGAPHPIFLQAIPEGERASREDLVRQADYYFEGLQRNDGEGYYNFTDDCVRFENAVDVLARPDPQTGEVTRTSCKKQFEESVKGIVTRIRDRRFVAVDRERGNVFAFTFFDHHQINWTWQVAEIFRIENGDIRRIEAIFHRAPFGINSGWSTHEQGMSEEIQSIR